MQAILLLLEILERPAPYYVEVAMFEGFLGSESQRFHRRTVDLKLQNDPLNFC